MSAIDEKIELERTKENIRELCPICNGKGGDWPSGTLLTPIIQHLTWHIELAEMKE